ncbi:hypothetical protein EWM64_g2433 [Hericium alpestre]|uniref:Polysaccharide lyase family 8 central domain-containing protein n=1 Tax=Hericium alpestre TaxID=135208 RepID=A0A4Z0A6Q1_9AGAM|nr:hypothetical protein EWM64_g2433 [Hericium alpestre]
MTARSYDTFYEGNKGYLSGANILDVAKIGIDLSLLTTNLTLITEAYGRIHNEVVVEPRNGPPTDGIQSDGAFDQHSGLLYNGNYGKDYSNDVLELEIDAGGTQFAADQDSREAFETLIDGDQWMIVLNKLTGVLHWDLSALPRFISFPVADAQATGSLNLNLTEIQELGQLWQSSTMIDVYNRLISPGSTANAGSLNGNRIFYSNDYMVQRGKGYVTTLKMYSSRTKNTECTNSQNPLGFHLADGAQYTYLQGDEYEDIAAAWDWNLIPGITVDSNNTVLSCDHASYSGIENFVGGVSNGKVGAAAMRYTNPLTKALSWQKAWFFLDDDVQYVMIANISSSSGAPVLSVLDQRRHDGDIYVNDKHVSSSGQSSHSFASTLWHGDVGYKFDNAFTELSLSVGEKTGDWSKIGTSTQPPTTVDLYAAWLEHKNIQAPVSYLAFPATDFETFQKKRSARDIRFIRNDAHLMAAYDADSDTIFAVFWDEAGGSVYLLRSLSQGAATISTSGNVALIYNMKSNEITVSDPSQTLSAVDIKVTSGWLGQKHSMTIVLPTGDAAGSSVTQRL